jgi:hypothetical protein
MLTALVALLFGLAMFAINHEPLNSLLTWILAPLAGAAALGFLIRHVWLPARWAWWFIRILTPRTNGEHPLAQAVRQTMDYPHPTTGSLLDRAVARGEQVRARKERKREREG